MDAIEFDATERAAILAEAQRLRAEPSPTDRRGMGCLTALGAGVVLLALPPLSKWLGWPQSIGQFLFWPLIVLLALGLFVGLFLTTSRYSRASGRFHEALAWFEGNPGVRDAEARRHAVALVCYRVINDDGGLAQVIDVDEAKEILGGDLPYVAAVERVLVEGAGENSSGVYFGKT